MESYKEITEFIDANIPGCHFVGIAEDDEVFIEYDDICSDSEFFEIREMLKTKFPYIKKVITVAKPSLQEAEEMLEGLNKYLENMEESRKPKLLDIE